MDSLTILNQALIGSIGSSKPSEYTIKLIRVVFENNQANEKMLTATCKIVALVDNGYNVTNQLGDQFNWCFPVAIDSEIRCRLIGDLVSICKQLGMDASKLGDDVNCDDDIYINFVSMCSKPIAKDTIGLIRCMRVRQQTTSKHYECIPIND